MSETTGKDYGKIIRIVLAVLVVVIALTIAYRIWRNNRHTANDDRPVVCVTNPKIQDITVYTEQIGTVETGENVNVIAMLAGEILEVNFKVGDTVKEGDVLVRVNADALDAYQIQIDSAKLQLEQAQAALERPKALYEVGSVSDSEMEQVQAAVDGAQLGLDGAQEQYDIQAKYANITAPVSGTIKYKNAEVHGFASQGTPVAIISADGTDSVTFGITDDSLNTIIVGDSVSLSKEGYEGTGRITEISNMIGQSGLYTVKADIDDASGLTTNSRVVVEVVKNHADDAVTIPISAVCHSGDESFVYVLSDDKAVKKTVDTGIYDDENIEIIDGVTRSDEIIYTWSRELYDGAEVIVNEQ